MNVEDKIIEKIRKLLALSEDAGSEHEAAVALSQAKKLMAKYQIEAASIEAAGESGGVLGVTNESFDVGKRSLYKYEKIILSAICNYNDCTLLSMSARKNKTSDFKGFRYYVVGTQSDVNLVKASYKYAVKILNSLAARHDGRGQKDIFDFKLGFSSGLSLQLHEKKEEEERGRKEDEDGSQNMTALILRKGDAVKRYLDDFNVSDSPQNIGVKSEDVRCRHFGMGARAGYKSEIESENSGELNRLLTTEKG